MDSRGRASFAYTQSIVKECPGHLVTMKDTASRLSYRGALVKRDGTELRNLGSCVRAGQLEWGTSARLHLPKRWFRTGVPRMSLNFMIYYTLRLVSNQCWSSADSSCRHMRPPHWLINALCIPIDSHRIPAP